MREPAASVGCVGRDSPPTTGHVGLVRLLEAVGGSDGRTRSVDDHTLAVADLVRRSDDRRAQLAKLGQEFVDGRRIGMVKSGQLMQFRGYEIQAETEIRQGRAIRKHAVILAGCSVNRVSLPGPTVEREAECGPQARRSHSTDRLTLHTWAGLAGVGRGLGRGWAGLGRVSRR